jgi:adenylate cyclase
MMVECTPLRQCLVSSMTNRPPPSSGIDPSLLQTVEVFERLPAERPAHDTLDAIAEWLIGPARRIASGTCALDEFAWRLLAAGLPLLQVTLHTSTLHPQFLGANFIWFRTTGQATLSMVAHELAQRFRDQDNPVRRVVLNGETLRHRIDVADAPLDFPILHDLKAQGATDYFALPVASAHLAHNYMVTYVIDRPGRLLRIRSRRSDARIATPARFGRYAQSKGHLAQCAQCLSGRQDGSKGAGGPDSPRHR